MAQKTMKIKKGEVVSENRVKEAYKSLGNPDGMWADTAKEINDFLFDRESFWNTLLGKTTDGIYYAVFTKHANGFGFSISA